MCDGRPHSASRCSLSHRRAATYCWLGMAGGMPPVQTVFELVGSGGPYAPGGTVSPKIDELLDRLRAMAGNDPARPGLMRDLSREISEQAATFPVMSRANIHACKSGCILNLVPYLPSGGGRFNDVHIAKGCK